MVSRGEYTGSRSKLDIDVLGKKNAGIFTIKEVEENEFPDEEAEDEDATRKQVSVVFREYPEQTWYVSRGDTVTLIDLFGDDESQWIGKKLPLVKKAWTYKRKKGVSLRLAELEDWRDIGVTPPKAKPAAKKAAVKRRRTR
jgi:hypothetical protein